MIEAKSHLPWPGADERIVVEEMLRDSISGHWYECRMLVKKIVQARAKNIPQDQWEDIVQEAMIRLGKSLSTFRYQCKLRTWLFNIVRSCIIDAHRKITYEGQAMALPSDAHDDGEREGDALPTNLSRTVEDECITRDELRKALVALQEYVSTHIHPTRNARILEMVLLEDHSLEAAATAVGCSAPVAGYVVRSAQRYVREILGYQR